MVLKESSYKYCCYLLRRRARWSTPAPETPVACELTSCSRLPGSRAGGWRRRFEVGIVDGGWINFSLPERPWPALISSTYNLVATSATWTLSYDNKFFWERAGDWLNAKDIHGKWPTRMSKKRGEPCVNHLVPYSARRWVKNKNEITKPLSSFMEETCTSSERREITIS